MPLVSVRRARRDTRLGIWRMTEDEASLLADNPWLESLSDCYGGLKSDTRRRERLTTLILIMELTGQILPLSHNDADKPLLEGWHVGVSHTRGWASVVVSAENEVSVDIEYVSNRVEKVASRFIRSDEQSGSLGEMLLNWSAKETCYKYYSELDLGFFDMRLLPYELKDKGDVEVRVDRAGETRSVGYELNSDYVLTYIL